MKANVAHATNRIVALLRARPARDGIEPLRLQNRTALHRFAAPAAPLAA
jgi:hypothetical protein